MGLIADSWCACATSGTTNRAGSVLTTSALHESTQTHTYTHMYDIYVYVPVPVERVMIYGATRMHQHA